MNHPCCQFSFNRVRFFSRHFAAIFAAGGILGPAIGYIVGGYFVTLWTDFPTVDE